MRTILVVDDDTSVLQTYALALTQQGYDVLTAPSGAEALDCARRHLPDLVLCDINMPGMDGRAVLQEMRRDPDLGSRQFVLMTGNPRDVTPRSGMELGADDFLVKPFTLQDLSRCVAARLARASVHWRVEDRAIAGLRDTLHWVLPHEFFTPLNGILGLVDVLRNEIDQLDPEETRELLAAIEESGWKLHRSLRNYLLLLDLGRIVDAAPAGVPLHGDALASALRTGVATAARRHQREQDVRVDTAAIGIVCAATDLAIVAEELVDNALRYSRHGTEVRIALSPAGELSVSDLGRGMTEEQLAQVGAFRQFDHAAREQQGLGLGLFLVRELARCCGAEVQIESEHGRGTTVNVRFVRSSGPTGDA
jgi:signal transduction histidine kinase